MSCHEKTFLYTCMRKMVKISYAVIVQLIIANILNQAGVPCSLTNSTGKFDFNPKHMLLLE